MVSPHAATSFDPVQWKNPERFDPDRYNLVPTSNQVDEAKCQQVGFVKCPFERTAFDDGCNKRVAMFGHAGLRVMLGGVRVIPFVCG